MVMSLKMSWKQASSVSAASLTWRRAIGAYREEWHRDRILWLTDDHEEAVFLGQFESKLEGWNGVRRHNHGVDLAPALLNGACH